MVCDLLVVDVAGLCDRLIAACSEHLLRKFLCRTEILQSGNIAPDLLCHCAREHTGIGTRIGDELFLVELLHDAQGLVRADLEHARAVVLQLGKVVQKRRIFLFLLFVKLMDHGRQRLRFGQLCHECLGILFFLKAVLLVELRRLEIPGTLHGAELALDLPPLGIELLEYTVERRLDELSDLALPAHDHTEHAGHDTSD